ncbi:MAG: RagB/SusD family nutrient uptake outer membrane protein [Gemmatimonadota bacterium]|nr:RagB/SusD family nutrient uptake outer membrane protein [Gemmatimonadota bacterium]MDE3006980.1 RagB/SusD family nutrient uptake outer membrane protein [Gemmatimonadota bacterium]MDE3014843.1 RagB/SusD family nutrient uptake outer membrane protein [Gemmatimonadota bacterium]
MTRINFKGVKTFARFMSLGLLVAAASCDTDVINPGPIDARFLDDPNAQAAMVNGAGRALSEALNWTGYTSAAIAREVHPSGSTGSFGITPEQQRGELLWDQVGTQWTTAHRARFMGDEAIRRIQALESADQDQTLLAQAHLYAGYTNRLLGEQMCQAVYDGGPAEANSDSHLQKAIEHFNSAASLGAGDIALAAAAGRASAHLMLGNWASAVADAGTIPAGFSYSARYFAIGDDTQSNRIYVAGKAQPYKAHSQIFTWIEQYNPETGGVANTDPRVSWRVSGENGDAASSCCGVIAWNPQTKYTNDDSPIELSSYEEMQLILAENEIMNNGDIGQGMAIINALRTAAGVATEAVPATQAEAMTLLKREHAIEMWLEGRRLPAMRRWQASGTPGDLQPLEQVSGDVAVGSHLSSRSLCFPIPESEVETNSNISASNVIFVTES